MFILTKKKDHSTKHTKVKHEFYFRWIALSIYLAELITYYTASDGLFFALLNLAQGDFIKLIHYPMKLNAILS